jgi:septum formation protein
MINRKLNDYQSSGQARGATSRVIKKEIAGVFKEQLILASTSPRRAEILNAVGWPFEMCAPNTDETRAADEEPAPYVKRLARMKAAAVANQRTEGLVLGADTVVVIEGEILGQPRDEFDARRMLGLLRGKWHEVLTGVALVRAGSSGCSIVEHETSRVRFGSMSADEIEWYVATGEPNGKAGAYGIQGSAALFIEEIQGDYFNIVGLPVRLAYELSLKI